MKNNITCAVIKKDGTKMGFDVKFEEGDAEGTRFAVFTAALIPAEGRGVALAFENPTIEAITEAMEMLNKKAGEISRQIPTEDKP